MEIAIRFLIGGFVVSAFSLISDLFKPKTFAGLFGAAPSVALASLTLTVMHQGKAVAAREAGSMILGGVALLVYALTISCVLLRRKFPTPAVAISGLLLWIGVAVGLWWGLR